MREVELLDKVNGKEIDMLTPEPLARYLISLIEYNEGDRFYDAFKGTGVFYDNMPSPKDWAEIKDGRDFFTYLPFDGKCEHIISNPPYAIYMNGRKVISLDIIMRRSIEIATKTIAYLLNHTLINSLTPRRLEEYKRMGWVITRIHVVSVKKWYGRYWFVIFQKGKNSIIGWDVRNW